MTFPSDYKVVRIAGGDDATVSAHVGAPREILINTTDGSIHVMDGSTPGGTKTLTLTALVAALQNTAYLPTGSKTLIENATNTAQDQRGWTPWALKDTFSKLADTTTAAWTILNNAMPAEMRSASRSVNDLNDAVRAGLYVADPASVLNLPSGVATSNNVNVGLLVIAQNLTNVIQVLFDRFVNGKVYTRVLIDSVWSSWVVMPLASETVSTQLQTLTAAQKGQARANIDGGILSGFRSKIIDGNFDFWHQALTQTNSGYGSADMWQNNNVGSTKIVSRPAFALGQTDVPGNPEFYYRTVVTSVAGSGNFTAAAQSIEDVSTFAGETATVTLWARADSAKNIAFELSQRMGTGGTPSADVLIAPVTLALTHLWQKFSFTITLPSVAGKTLGTNGDDRLTFAFWLEAGADWNARTNSLGQQSGTFDIARVSFVKGDATAEADPTPAYDKGIELTRVQRYYEVLPQVYVNCPGYSVNSRAFGQFAAFNTTKRIPPILSHTVIASAGVTGSFVDVSQVNGCRVGGVSIADGSNYLAVKVTADSRL